MKTEKNMHEISHLSYWFQDHLNPLELFVLNLGLTERQWTITTEKSLVATRVSPILTVF